MLLLYGSRLPAAEKKIRSPGEEACFAPRASGPPECGRHGTPGHRESFRPSA
jgi:hypothetical protein